MAANLASVYVNHNRVRLQGEPRPQVTQVVKAAGEDPQKCEVYRLNSENDTEGRPMSIDEFIDRTEEVNAIWLKLQHKGGTGEEEKTGQPSSFGGGRTTPQQKTTSEMPTPSTPMPGPGSPPEPGRERSPAEPGGEEKVGGEAEKAGDAGRRRKTT